MFTYGVPGGCVVDSKKKVACNSSRKRKRFRQLRLETLEARLALAIVELFPTQSPAEIRTALESPTEPTTFVVHPGTYLLDDVVLSGNHNLIGFPDRTTFDAQGSGRALILRGFDGVISGVEFTNGAGDYGGNLVVENSRVFLDQVQVTDGFATVAGAGAFFSNSDVTISESEFRANRQGESECNCFLGDGSAWMAVDGSTVLMANSTVLDSSSWGAAAVASEPIFQLHTTAKTIELHNNVFQDNSADFAIDVRLSGVQNVRISNNQFFGNKGLSFFDNPSVQIAAAEVAGQYLVANNTFYEGDIAIEFNSFVSRADVTNNVIVDYHIGIRSNMVNSDHNLFFGFGPNDMKYADGRALQTGDTEEDPKLIDPSQGNFDLQADSPLKNTGRPDATFRNWDGTRNTRGHVGWTPKKSVQPDSISASFELLTGRAFIESQGAFIPRPTPRSVPAVDGLNFTDALKVRPAKLNDANGTVVEAIPRLAANQGGDIHPMEIFHRKQGETAYARADFDQLPPDYSALGLSLEDLPPDVAYHSRIQIAAPDPTNPQSFPLDFTYSGDDVFGRLASTESTFGTSSRLGGATNPFGQGEQFAYSKVVFVEVEPGAATVMFHANADLYAVAVRLTIRPGVETKTKTEIVWFARQDIDPKVFPNAGPIALSTMMLRDSLDTPAITDDSAHDVDVVKAVYQGGLVQTLRVDNPADQGQPPGQAVQFDLGTGTAANLTQFSTLQIDRNRKNYSGLLEDYADRVSIISDIETTTHLLTVRVLVNPTIGETDDNVAIVAALVKPLLKANRIQDALRVTLNQTVGKVESLVNSPPSMASVNSVSVDEDVATAPISVTVDDPELGSASVLLSANSLHPTLISDSSIVLGGTGANRTLTLTPSKDQHGTAHIRLTAGDGLTTSQKILTVEVKSVNDPPTISLFEPLVIREDSIPGLEGFIIGDVDSSLDSLVINVNSSDTAIAPIANFALRGTGPTREVSFTPPKDQTGTALISVTVTDPVGAKTTTQFPLTITPVNDGPTITSAAAVEVQENTQAVVRITATDVDGPTDAIQFSVAAGADQQLFTLNPVTGELRFLTAPDFEQPADADRNNTFEVTVQATDNLGTTSQQNVAVKLLPINEFPPTITLRELRMDENSLVVGQIDASDLDLPIAPIEHVLIGGSDSHLFQLDPLTGVLAAKTPPNYEQPADSDGDNSYQLRVEVTDGGGRFSSQDVTVVVDPVNEFAPVVSSSDSVNIAENATEVVVVRADDDDLPRQPLKFEILTSGDSAQFQINETTGQLSLRSAVNFEQPADSDADNVYRLIISASDQAGRVQVQNLSVTVTDVNEPPVLAALANASVLERVDGATIATLSVDDPDSGQTHSILSSDSRFQLSGNTLRLVDDQHLKQADGAAISLQLNVTDSGSPPQSATFSVTLSVHSNPNPWTNPNKRNDTNGDGQISPNDVLIVINEINLPTIIGPSGQLPFSRSVNATKGFIDPNADGLCTSNDALRVINEFNSIVNGEGEKEGDAGAISVAVIPWIAPVLVGYGAVPPLTSVSIARYSNGDDVQPIRNDILQPATIGQPIAQRCISADVHRQLILEESLEETLDQIVTDILSRQSAECAIEHWCWEGEAPAEP